MLASTEKTVPTGEREGILVKTVYIANDHAAVALKNELIGYIEELGFQVINLGTDTDERVDYPEYAEKTAYAVRENPGSLGILICGTGIGMSLAANKVHGIRAAAVSEVYSAKLTRMHNDANILCIGARVIGVETAKMIAEAFLTTPFEGGRHQTRVDQIRALEAKEAERAAALKK